MRYSQILIPTLREDPVEAHVVSHRLMLRAGLIRQLGAGIYTWLPLGLRVLRRVAGVVRQEMDRAGGQEVLLPAVIPAELWQESGRWQIYGKELLRLRDRHDREYCFGPTHEEVITDLVRREVRSYRQLPLNFYQIQTKFRDEIRPRFGVMRGREFLMKDAYSFDADEASLERSYQVMYRAYERIFQRCGLRFRAVEADTGAIGGAYSHEFHVLAESGEDTIAACDQCAYAANLEKAVAGPQPAPEIPVAEMREVVTPGQRTIEEVSGFLGLPPSRMVKSLAVETERGPFLLLLRGDHALNEIKARAALGVDGLTFPGPERVRELAGVPAGFLGPITGGASRLPVVADAALQGEQGWACGANQEDRHLVNVRWERDLPWPRFEELRNVVAGDPCPRCAPGRLGLTQGIEVGHVFKLGDKYSRAMGVKVLDQQGKETIPLMGCYGIGVSRIVGAVIEQNHDDNGILWPLALAPFQVILVLLNPKDAASVQVVEALYADLQRQGVAVLLDDREERAGVKFKDAELLGCPLRAVVGGRSFKDGMVEVQWRRQGRSETTPVAGAADFLVRSIAALCQEEDPERLSQDV